MTRMIPKNSKIRLSLFKGMTLIDMLIICVGLGLGMMILATNLKIKWQLLAIVALITVLLILGSGEDKTYRAVFYMLRFVFSRKTYRKGGKKRDSVSTLIPFESIEQNGIIVYEGYFGAVIEIGSICFGLLDEDEQDFRIAAFARVLNGLSQSSPVIQIVKIDRPINYDEISARLYEKIENLKAEEVEHPTEGERARAAVLSARLEQIDRFNNIETQYRPFYYIILFDHERESLIKSVDVCKREINQLGLDAKALNGRETAVFFKYCYTLDFDERNIDDVAPEDYSEYVKPDRVKFHFGSHEIDGVFAFTMAVKDYPLYVGNSWAAELFNIENTKVVMTLRAVDKDKAVKRIDRAFVESGARNLRKLSDANAQETHLQTLEALQLSIQNENELLFDTTLAITGFNRTEESDKAFRKALRRRVISGGFRISPLVGRQFDGFAASTVARGKVLSGCERGINSDSLAATFPFVFSSLIDLNGCMLGYDGEYPVIIDLWKRDGDQYVNSNGIVFGKSGAGKSFFQKLLLLNAYSENTRIFILDPENEYNVLAKNVNGAFVDVGSATKGRLNPLHVYPVLTEDGEPADPQTVFSSHLQFLESFFKITLTGITSDSLEELNSLMVRLYEKKNIGQDTDCTELSPEDFPIFDDLLSLVEEELQNGEYTAQRRANLERLNTYVRKFAAGGMYSNLWNGPSTLVTNERLVVFNFQSLFAAKNKIVSSAQMLVVMRYLDQQIINIREFNRAGSRDVLHPLIVVDEGYNFIDPKYPVALDFIFQWYKRIRKYEGGILFATQNLSDVLGNNEVVAQTTAIVNNSQYSFVFSLAPADLETLTELYRNAGGINDTERHEILNAGNGECFAICSARDRAFFHVHAHETVRSIFDEENAMDYLS